MSVYTMSLEDLSASYWQHSNQLDRAEINCVQKVRPGEKDKKVYAIK